MSIYNFDQKDESFPERMDPSVTPSGAERFPQQTQGTDFRGGNAAQGAAEGFAGAHSFPNGFRVVRSAPGSGVYESAAAGAPAESAGADVSGGCGAAPVSPMRFGGEPAASGEGVFEPAASGRESYGGGPYRAEPAWSAPSGTTAASGFYGTASGPAAPIAASRTTGKTKKAGRLGKGAVALALCCSLIGGAAGAGGVLLVKGNAGGENSSVSESANTRPTTSVMVAGSNGRVEYTASEPGTLLSAEQVYENNVNSTVGITTEITTTNFFGFTSTAAASGSGFILTHDGYILTNHHVIEDANSITVTTYDGTRYNARLVGSDAKNDIAVLKIDGKNLQPVKIGSSSTLKVGQDVIAIGNPLGELTFSLTKGVVSALDREVTMSNRYTMNLIQTDCAINSGNSGGALFNLYGEVVGITNAKFSTNAFSGQASIDNIGFAIPIDSVLELVASIIERGN